MAMLSVAEMVNLIGGNTTDAHIRVWKKRGKLHSSERGMFDTDHPLNRMFITQKRLQHGKSAELEINHDTVPGKKTDWNDPEDVKEHKRNAITYKSARDDEAVQMTKRKEELAIQKLEQEIKLIQAKNDKLSGETIPTELVGSAFAQFGKSTVTAFMNAAEDMLLKFSAMKQLTRDEYATLKGDIKKSVNAAASEAIRTSKAQIRNIVEEYSQRRGRGERE